MKDEEASAIYVPEGQNPLYLPGNPPVPQWVDPAWRPTLLAYGKAVRRTTLLELLAIVRSFRLKDHTSDYNLALEHAEEHLEKELGNV